MYPQSFGWNIGEGFPSVVEALREAEALLALLEEGGDDVIDKCIKAGVISRLVGLLNKSGETFALLTTTVLASLNLIMNSKRVECVTAVVNAGSIPYFVRFLKSQFSDVALAAMLALNQITATLGGEILAREPGVLENLLGLTASSDSLMVSLTMSTVVDVLSSKPSEDISLRETKRYASIFVPLLERTDFDSLLWTCAALCTLVRDGSPRKTKRLVRAGVVPTMMRLLRRGRERESSETMVYFILLSLCRIVIGGEKQRLAVLEAGVTDYLQPYIMHKFFNIERHAGLLVVYLIADGRTNVITNVFERKVVPPLLQLLERCTVSDQAMVILALMNFILKSEDRHMDRFLVQHLTPSVIDLRRMKNYAVVVTFLDGFRQSMDEAKICGKLRRIQRVLTECGGSYQVKPLMKHPNGQVRYLATKLVHEYLRC